MGLKDTFTGQKLEPYQNPQDARQIAIKIGASKTLAAGTVVARLAATELWDAYADGGAGGLEVARAILVYAVATDSGGKHFLGGAAASENGESFPSVPAYISGDFLVGDLTGLDANGLAELQGRIIYGDDLNDAEAVVHIG